jgi:hypothetical protein
MSKLYEMWSPADSSATRPFALWIPCFALCFEPPSNGKAAFMPYGLRVTRLLSGVAPHAPLRFMDLSASQDRARTGPKTGVICSLNR